MKISWIRNLVLISSVLITTASIAQSSNTDFERVVIKKDLYILSGVDLSHDQKTLAISSTQSNPFYLFDIESRQVKAEWDVANWYAGSEVQFSANDSYVLLRQLFYLDFNLNKDREVEFEIIDAKTGRLIKRFVEYHQVIITEDEQYAVTISGDEITFWSLPDANRAKSFKVTDATNAIAVSPNGKWIAVSHQPDADRLKKDPRYKKNKKSLKIDSKFKERVSVFDTENFKHKYTVDDLYNIVYKMDFSKNGEFLFIQHIPHSKAKSATTFREAYVSMADANTGEALRKGFMARTNAEPQFKLSHDGRYFGVVSFTNRFPEVQIYDFETGRMLDRFEQAYRLYEKNAGESILPPDGRTAFDFLPDNETVVMIMGNHLVYWKPKLNQ